jgi:hypothetical protein
LLNNFVVLYGCLPISLADAHTPVSFSHFSKVFSLRLPSEI